MGKKQTISESASGDKYYVTTSIAYVNGSPHIGYASELLQADVLARWNRLLGNDTFYLTGTDENTLKLVKAAKNEGTEPRNLADKYAEQFKRLTTALNLSNDYFIRTTDERRHHPGAQKVWEALVANGYIYKGTYEGMYCVDCEQFYTDKETADGKCPVHGITLEHQSEKNYLFKLSAFTGQLKELITSGAYQVDPEERRHEILALFERGLQDVSFSRPSDKLSMGVPVPGDPSQTMYVWCDALTNYITGVGYPSDMKTFRHYWPADVHIIGKDIIRFHAAYWPAMLLGAGLPLPKRLYVHGFFTIEGEKMSKSKGNVIDPFELCERHGVDPVRYCLLASMPYAGDGNYAEQRFQELYDSHLANDLGNLVSRVLAMVESGYGGTVNAGTADPSLMEHVAQAHHGLKQLLDDCRFADALETLNNLVSAANRYIEEKQPWNQEGQANRDTLYSLVQVLGHLSHLYEPFIPATAEKLRRKLGTSLPGNWQEMMDFEIKPDTKITKGEPLFPKT